MRRRRRAANGHERSIWLLLKMLLIMKSHRIQMHTSIGYTEVVQRARIVLRNRKNRRHDQSGIVVGRALKSVVVCTCCHQSAVYILALVLRVPPVAIELVILRRTGQSSKINSSLESI